MTGKRCIAILAIVALLGVGTLRPMPARAADAETFAIAGAALVVYIIVAVIATKLIFGLHDTDAATIEDPTLTYQKPDGTVHFTPHCQQNGGAVTVACW